MFNNRLFFLITVLFGYAWSLSAQPQIEWDTLLGEKGVDEAVGAVQNYDGRIGILASTVNGEWLEDFWFLLMDVDGRIIRSTAYGTVYSDRPKKILKTHDGGYLLIGEMDRTYGSPQSPSSYLNPIIIKLNADGEKEKLSIVFLQQDFMVKDAIETLHGRFYLLLQGNKQHYLFRHPVFSLAYEPTVIPMGETYHYEKLVEVEGEYWIVGRDNSGDVVLVPFDPDLQSYGAPRRIEVTYPVETIHKAYSNAPDQIVVTGSVRVPRQQRNAALLTVDLKTESVRERDFGGRLHDEAYTSITLADGTEWLAGYSLSNRESRSRVADGYHVIQRQDGTSESFFTGGTGPDEVKALLSLAHGGVLTLETTGSGEARRKDIRVTKFETLSVPINPQLKLIARDASLMDEDRNNIWEPGEYAYVEMEIENPHDGPYSIPYINVFLDDSIQGVHVPDSIVIGSIPPGQRKLLQIPLQRNRIYKSQEVTLRITCECFENPIALNISIAHDMMPDLAFGAFTIELGDSATPENPYLEASIEVINRGSAPSDTLELILRHPNPLESDTRERKIHPVVAGSNLIVKRVLLPNSLTLDTLTNFILALYNRSDSLILKNEVKFDVNMLLEPLRIRGDLVTGEKERRREPNIRFIWTDPSPLKDFDDYKEWELAQYPIQLYVTSNKALDREDVFCDLYVNGNQYNSFKGSEKLIGGEQRSSFQYRYKEEVLLEEGENRIYLEINEDGTVFHSTPMIIDYIPPRSNAHVYAFGVPQDKIPHLAKDAADFARLFKNQEKQLFNQVNIHLFNTDSATTSDKMRENLNKLENDYLKFKLIKENDVIIIYFSTHGFLFGDNNEEFRLASSDFDRNLERAKSLNFETEILDVLRDFDCKVIIFIDACYSGQIANLNKTIGVKGADSFDLQTSKALARLAEAENGIYFMLSCNPGENSYSDESWGNSAFTKAIVEYLDPRDNTMSWLPDPCNDDRIITLGELACHIEKSVPEIVKTKKGIDTSQHPMFVNGDEVLDLPFYVRNK